METDFKFFAGID